LQSSTVTCHSLGWICTCPIERRPPLNQSHATRFADALRATLGLASVTARERESRHCRRLRDVTPQRLTMESGAYRVVPRADEPPFILTKQLVEGLRLDR
jgi:hypothetical protein